MARRYLGLILSQLGWQTKNVSAKGMATTHVACSCAPYGISNPKGQKLQRIGNLRLCLLYMNGESDVIPYY